MTNQFTKLDLINFSENAYNPVDNPELPIPDGYQRVNISMNDKDPKTDEPFHGNEGFKGAAYYNPTTNDLVIAYGGTDLGLEFFKDADDDSGFVTGANIDQAKLAQNFYDFALKKVNDDNPGANLTKDNITLTGHSLGGGLAAMIGILKDVVTKVINAPGVGKQLDNIEKMDDEFDPITKEKISDGALTKNSLTSKDPSTFKVTNYVVEGDGVHYAGTPVGNTVKLESKGSVLGAVLDIISGVAGAALISTPIGAVGGAAIGIFAKFFGSSLFEKHLIGVAREIAKSEEAAAKGDPTIVDQFKSSVESVDKYINTGMDSIVKAVNGGINWLEGSIDKFIWQPVADAAESALSFLKDIFNGHDGAAPTNADGTVNNSAINNSLLNLTINTDKLKDFAADNNSLNQTGNVIGDADWQATMPINVINGDGYKNVVSAGIVSDGFRPGNQELSSYFNFNTQLNADFSRLDNLANQLNRANQNQSFTDISKLNLQLQNPLANLTNNFINARTFLNIDPVVLDLNGDGVKLTSYQNSEVTFDVDNDGKQERTGWVSNQDGILVDDKNHNGKIDNITETISEYYNPNDGSVADDDGKYSSDGLAALKKLDSNHDGKFNNQDAKWNDLKIWVDANGDAVTDAGELKTLNEAGIKEFDLTNIIQANKERNEGNVILAKATYTTTDNQIKQVAAVDFTTNPIGYEFNDVNLGKLATAEDGTKSLVISDTNGATVTASNETAQNIFGNVGNDTIIGDARDNWISGGLGSDTLKGGDGDDILIIDSEDKQENVDGGEGRDIVIINSDKGVSFNLTESYIETAVGGNGDDVLIGGGTSNVFIDGGSGDDIIIGGAADDALAGSDGNDYVDGGYGDDIVRGHRGNDVLIGGEGNDYIEGGLDDDQVFAGNGNDVIMEGAGNDQIDGGEGYDLVKYNGSYKDYKVSRDGANYKIQDLKTGNTDSIKNIEGVRFNDATLKLVDGNISPLPVADLITLQNKSDNVFITKDDLLKNDLDVDGDSLTIISVQNATGGAARLVKDNNGAVLGVQWTPDKSFIGNMSFDYDIKDSKGAYTIVEQRNNDGTSVTAAMKARVTFKLSSDPTDELYAKQWYLSEINVQKAWADYSGEGIKIGVFEKGDFNINHEELDGNTLQSHKDDVTFRQVEQYSQHKTTVAGVIAAEKNGSGIVGVAYNAELDGYSWDADETGLINLKNVDIANNSWGAIGEFSDNFSDPNNPYASSKALIEDSVKEGRDGLGTINIFAGGNSRAEGDNVNYHNLQNSRFVITTGSINQPGDLATLTEASTPFSNPGDAILVSAPGSNINSTGNLLTNANGSQFLGEFSSSQGTSFSAPIVSGVVALMLQANPNLGYRDVQKILALSARQFNDPNTVWQENGATNWNGGAMHFSHDYGFGIVDAAAAVRLAETWDKQSTYYNENFFTAENSDRIAIADNATVGKQFTITNSNMHNIETVEVEVNLSHLSLSDLTIKLVSPSGTESILMDKPSDSVYEGGLVFNFSSRAFLGENVDGDWKLLITDSKTGDVGYLNSWKLKFYGELNDGKNDLYVYTDEFAKMTDGSRGIISDTDGGTDTINASAVSSDTTINLNAGKTSKIAGHDVLISGGTPGEEYYQKKALLPTKEAELVTKNSELTAKNQSLTTKQTEFAGLESSIYSKVSSYNQKQAEYDAALKAYNENSSKIWFDSRTYLVTYGTGSNAEHFYKNNVTGGTDKIYGYQRDQKINDVNNAVNTLNQKAEQANVILAEYNALIAKRSSLPEEIGNLNNEVAALSNQTTSLQSEVNFIKTYLNAFNENGASAIENAYTGDGNDTIIGSDLNNRILGGRGENTLTGNGGADIFAIKESTTTVDTITDFKPGEDKIDLTDFGNIAMSNLSIVQNGVDAEIRFTSGQKIILKNINAGQVLTDSFIGIAEVKNPINGGMSDDVLVGTNQGDLIKDIFGNDVIKALGGNDEIDAGMGNDRIFGGAGDDVIYGGRGNDFIYADGDLDSSGNIIGNDTRGGNNKVFGGDGDDVIFGGSGNDYIDGGNGNDTIYAGAGNDTIIVGSGNNQVQAGSGNDIIDLSSAGGVVTSDRVNFVSGGEGSDRFILDNAPSFFNEINVISDFDINDPNERIDLSKLTSINKFSDLKISQQGSDAIITVSTNFFGKSQTIKLQNVDASKLNASKFIITNEAPRAVNDGVSTGEDQSITINITANDSDDKTDLSKLKVAVNQPANGTVVVNSNGTVTYTPKANFNGIDQFEYQLTDAGGLVSGRAKVTINIDLVNDAPIVTKVIADQVFYSSRGISFKVNDVFTEVDGEGLTYNATLSDGSPLPSWLNFSSVTQQFSGKAPNESGDFTIRLTATDDSGNATSTNLKFKIDSGIVLGTDGNDVINGTTGNDVIDGGKGDDIINGGNGNDTLFGGEGNDKIYSSGWSNDTLTGDAGSDIFIIGNDAISNDVITDFDITDEHEKIDLSNFAASKHGISTLARIADLNMVQVGNDVKITFSNSSKTLTIKNVKVSDLTADKFILNNAPTIASTISDQKIFITKDFSLNIAGTFNDMDGDSLSYSAKLSDGSPLPSWLVIDSASGNFSGHAPETSGNLNVAVTATDRYGASSSANFKLAVDDKIIFGTDGNDNINGTASSEAIEGGKGDDIINGGNGSDVIFGGEGNDTLYGANSGYSNTITGNSGSDTFIIKDGIISNDVITDFNVSDPNEKIDLTNFNDSSFSVVIRDIAQLNMVQFGSDVKITFNSSKTLTVKNVQVSQLTADKFIGLTDNYNSTADLTVNGTYRDETLYGGKGNDTIRSNGGNDSIFAGAGNDKLYGGDGNTSFTGNNGSDTFVIQGSYGSDVINDFNVSDANEKIDLSSFKDVATDLSQLVMDQVGLDTKISFTGKSKTILIKNVNKSQLTVDKFIGLTDNKSNPNNLVLTGTSSNDTLTGGTGDDIINGDRGNDIIKGNTGNNLLTGGAGNDTFIISKNPNKTDVITDFNAVDLFQLDGFTAGTKITDFTYTQEGNAVTFDLGDGQKLIFQNAIAADLLFYLSFTSQINLSDSSSVISYIGTAADEKIVISTSNRDGDVINGGDGNDLLIGNIRDDTLNGGKGNDTLVGGYWSDIFEVNKNPGDKDRIIDLKINNMVDSIVLKGFTDSNLANYLATQVGNDVVINLGDGQTLTLKNFKAEDVPYIASYNNRIYPTQTTTNGTDGDDLISRFDLGSFRGLAVINGGKGNDVLKGSSFDTDYFVIDKNPGDRDFVRSIDTSGGDKVIFHGFGNDILDKIKFLPSSDQYTLIMDLGDGQILRTYGVTQSQFRQYFDVEKSINATDGNDNLSAGYIGLAVDGKAGDDNIMGNSWGNTLTGGDGNDKITAGSGNDIINGGAGNDNITTGAGNDVVDAGSGNDEINITDGGNKTITGGDGSDTYKISSFTGEITITDFAISDPNEKINLKSISNIFSFSDLAISQQGADAVIQLSSSQKLTLKNIDKTLLTADKFVLYNNHFEGLPISDSISGGDGNDVINSYSGDDSVSLSKGGADIVDLGSGNDSFSVSGSGYAGNDIVTGGTGNDKFSIDLGSNSYYYDSNGNYHSITDYTLTINDFEAKNPEEKIYVSNGGLTNMNFANDLNLEQIGSDVQISLKNVSGGKKLLLKNVNLADLNKNNIVLPKELYKPATTALDDHITYDPNAGSENLLGQDRGISMNGTLTNVALTISGNYTTITLRAFDPTKDRIKVDPSYGVIKYSDVPLTQEGGNVVMNFVNESIPLTSGGSSFGATRYTKVILENISLTDLKEGSFIFYNHSTSGNDSIYALDGNDYIESGDGDDTIDGGNGNDELRGGNGKDAVSGGVGDDMIYGDAGDDNLSDYSGTNEIHGGAGNDSLGISDYYSGQEDSDNKLYGEEGNDKIHLDVGTNSAFGGSGDDLFIIYGGDNELHGGSGVDEFVIGRSYSSVFNGSEVVTSDAASSTIISDFDPTSETITLDGFEQESFDQFNIIQDGDDVVFSLSQFQTLRLNNVQKSDLNSSNVIIPNKHIQDNYTYTFNDLTREYSVENIKKLAEENSGYAFYPWKEVVDIASTYDKALMKTVSTFDPTQDKIHLGKNKSVNSFADLKITQHTVEQSYGSPSEFTLIDLGNGTFVKLLGFYTLTADNFIFNKTPIADNISNSIDEDNNGIFDVISKAFDADDDMLTITSTTNPSNGAVKVIIDSDGKQKISYQPNANFHGTDQFDYTISDGRGGIVTKTINVNVNSVNDAPVFENVTTVNYQETKVNSYTNSYQFGSSIAALSDGGWVVSWESDGQDGSGSGIYAQRYSSDGQPVGSEFKVNSYTNSNQSSSSITALNDGGWIVSWQSDGQDGSSNGIYAQRYSSDGQPAGSEFQVNSYTVWYQSSPSISALSDGGWIVSWISSDQDGSSNGIYAQRYSASGQSVGSEFKVNSYTNSAQSYPSTTSLEDGGWVISWQSYGQDGSGQGIYAQRYSADGQPAGNEFRVNSYTFKDQSNPSITALKDGGWVVSWESTSSQESSSYNIYAQRYSGDGQPVGSEFKVNSYTSGNQWSSSVAALNDGGWVVSWQSDGQDGSGDIYAQRYSSDGQLVGSEFKINSYTNDAQASPSIDALSDGGWVVSWRSYNQDGSSWGIYSQRYSVDGTKVDTITTLTSTKTATLTINEDASSNPAVIGATDSDGNALAYILKEGFLPQKGVVTFDQVNGTYSYIPNPNENGSDSFTILISDGKGGTAELKVNTTINPVNDAPILSKTSAVTDEDSSVLIDVLSEASDADGDILSIIGKTNPLHGIVSIVTDEQGKQKLSYTPNTNFNGVDQFNYTVSDGKGGVVTKAINITVNAINDNPIVLLDNSTINEDGQAIIDVLADATDVDGDQLSILGVYGVKDGTADIVDGKIVYTPNANYNGNTSFNYTISDGNGGFVTKSINVTVNAVNDTPVATISSASTDEDTKTVVDVMSGVSDVDGDSLTLSLVNGPTNGTAKIVDVTTTDSDGNQTAVKKIEYNPNNNFNGSDSLVYSVSDGNGGIVTKTLNIIVNSVNEAPVAANDNVSLSEDNSIKISALTNDSDVEDGSFEKNNIAIIAAALHGSVVLNDDLTFTYTPDGNYFGADSFSYQIKDRNGSSSNVANVYLDVASVNDAVMIDGVAESQNLAAGKFFSYDFSKFGFSDADGDKISVSIKLANGNDIPSWLSFDSEARILSGTPSDSDAGSIALQLVVSDGKVETVQKFDLAISKPITQNPNIAVNVITISESNDLVSANKGTVDIVTGNDSDNTFQYEQDDIWTETNIVAWNPYTNDQFSVVGKVRSFDAFDGGGGNNTLNLTDSDDVLALDDLISYNPSESGSRLFGIKIINAKGGNDIIDLSSNRFSYGDVTINGSDGNNILWGNDGNDTINGENGNDHIVGGRGADIMSGGDGSDTIKGYDGDDILIGGKGADVMIGGAGNDQFIFTDLTHSTTSEMDNILDFVRFDDKINLTGLGFDSVSEGVGSASAHGIEYYFEGGNTIIEDPNSNFAVKLAGQIQLDHNDFAF